MELSVFINIENYIVDINIKQYININIIYIAIYIRGSFNKFPDFFVQAFKIVVNSWKFTRILLYTLWDD